MPADSQQDTYQRPALEFKSSSLTVPVLILTNNDLEIIKQQLNQKIQQAPEFFRSSPVLLDIQELANRHLELNIDTVIEIIRNLELIPIGLRGGTEEQHECALELGLAVFSIHNAGITAKTHQQKKIAPPPEQQHKQKGESKGTKLLTRPVRSGQQIYAQGDLIILAQVSAGAEIMAEGNIHIYGTLRGKALAGVQGDKDSRIFCSNLQAELVSIAGNYRINENLDNSVRGQAVQIYLQDQTLTIKAIGGK